MPAYYAPQARCDCGARWLLAHIELPEGSAAGVIVTLPITTRCPECGQAFTLKASWQGDQIYLIRQPTDPPPTPDRA